MRMCGIHNFHHDDMISRQFSHYQHFVRENGIQFVERGEMKDNINITIFRMPVRHYVMKILSTCVSPISNNRVTPHWTDAIFIETSAYSNWWKVSRALMDCFGGTKWRLVHSSPGAGIVKAIWSFNKTFSQWENSFHLEAALSFVKSSATASDPYNTYSVAIYRFLFNTRKTSCYAVDE